MAQVCLALNAGSSSLKFQIFEREPADEKIILFRGMFERLNGSAYFVVKDGEDRKIDEKQWPQDARVDHEAALLHLVAWLQALRKEHVLAAIGHRVAHGGAESAGPVLIDDKVIEDLEKLVPLAPLHQPFNLGPIRFARQRLPAVPQIACFDTSFHQSQPEVATTYALPLAVRMKGVRRYGFHGLSYEYISSVLNDYDPALSAGRVIVAHLGSGASMCALHKGKSVATTMGFSALDGLPMGTRCGALDPGVIFYMIREMGMSADEVERMLYTKSGLLALSGLSNDMRLLREKAAGNPDARLAIDLFTYRICREAGSLMAALGGLDGFIFTAGIGENDPQTRAEVLQGLAWAGLSIDEPANHAGLGCISRGSGPSAWVIPTNEELVIARQIRRLLRRVDAPSPQAVSQSQRS
jgi:acetate kinase